jgi:hypothetical protein
MQRLIWMDYQQLCQSFSLAIVKQLQGTRYMGWMRRQMNVWGRGLTGTVFPEKPEG